MHAFFKKIRTYALGLLNQLSLVLFGGCIMRIVKLTILLSLLSPFSLHAMNWDQTAYDAGHRPAYAQCAVVDNLHWYRKYHTVDYWMSRCIMSEGPSAVFGNRVCSARFWGDPDPSSFGSSYCGPYTFPSNYGASNSYPSNSTCHPINIATGNKFFSNNDFVGQGINPLRLTYFYNSRAHNKVWTSSYRQSLIITTGVIEAKRADGQILSFTLGDGVINAQSQRAERLVLTGDTYELTLPDNTLESYNLSGQLLSIRYSTGLTHLLTYGVNIVTISRYNDSLVLHLTDDNITSVTLSDGSIINYVFDTTSHIDRLTKVTYADNSTRMYLYENTAFPSYITSIEDANGNTISSVEYDDQGRAISSEMGELNSGIERSQIEYHDEGTRTVTNALGKQNINIKWGHPLNNV